MIYLLHNPTRDCALFKVGFTTNINKRLISYATENPTARLIETVETYAKTRHKVETAIKAEIAKRYPFVISPLGTTTEWFRVPIEEEEEFLRQGLAQFTTCKRRKITRYTDL